MIALWKGKNPIYFGVKGQGHRVKFLGKGIHHALPLFSLDLVSMINKQDF